MEERIEIAGRDWVNFYDTDFSDYAALGLDVFHRVRFTAALVHSACGLGGWCFSMNKKLFFSVSPAEKEFLLFFELGGCLDYALEHAEEFGGPMLLTDALDLLWIADFIYADDKPNLLIVWGPVFNSQSSIGHLEAVLRKMDVSLMIRDNLLDKLQLVPILSYPNIAQYTCMLHFTLSGKRIGPSTFHYQETSRREDSGQEHPLYVPEASPEWTRTTEQMLLQLVREGNIHGRAIVDRAVASIPPDNYKTGEPQRDAKNTVLIFTALCARAAMDGGLSPKTAKELEVYYIGCIEKCNRISDLVSLNSIMLEDFIQRVHQCKESPGMSDAVQECCSYIQSHLEQPLKLEDLAARVGYTEYYLTKKFRKETGERLVDYIRSARIERAKILLSTSELTIQEISDKLQFGARTYFTKIFRQIVGVSPVEYRDKKGGSL